jgi:tetratricopeptide (TPR) repeat protein
MSAPYPLLRSACVALVCLCVPAARADEVTELRAMLARGDAQAALALAQTAAAARPRDAQLRFLQAVALMDLKRDDEALALFTRLSQEYPELPDPQNNIALLHARVGRLDQARQALEAALRSDPSHRLARTNLGQVYLMLAVQTWEMAAAVAPLEPALQRRLEAVRVLLLPAAR